MTTFVVLRHFVPISVTNITNTDNLTNVFFIFNCLIIIKLLVSRWCDKKGNLEYSPANTHLWVTDFLFPVLLKKTDVFGTRPGCNLFSISVLCHSLCINLNITTKLFKSQNIFTKVNTKTFSKWTFQQNKSEIMNTKNN